MSIAVAAMRMGATVTCLAILSACSGPVGSPPAVDGAGQAPPPPIRVEPLELPVEAAAQPDLVATPDGRWMLSWVEPVGEGKRHRLRFSQSAVEGGWSTPRTIAEGDDWFLNWADTPHVQALSDGSLWAHWLRSTGPARMDYGIDLVRSGDDGATWSEPRLVHLADSSGDHGFVSFWPQSGDTLGIAWLDSRQKAAAEAKGHAATDDDAHHGGGAPMMLRAATHGPGATQEGEWPLDTSTCDCCTTDAAITDRGPVVVYRGRTEGEVRDTRIVRFENGTWTTPHDVHRDGWVMPGCPVNGPVVEARGNTVWVAWFTQADGVPELRLARSDDAGDTFSVPVTVAKGAAVLGRVTMGLSGDALWLAWLEEASAQSLHVARYDADDLAAAHRRVEVATLVARGRGSGIPRLVAKGDEVRVVWTDVDDGRPVLRGVRIH